MKDKVISILILLLISGIIPINAQELTEKEETLADSLEFDHAIFRLVRSKTDAEFVGAPKNDQYEYAAIVLHLARNEAGILVDELKGIKHQLINKGYIVFKGTRSGDGEADEVRIVKHNDPLYPIKYMKTQGSFPKLSTEQIFDKIERWHGRKGCIVTGAGANWVEVKFVLSFVDMNELANDMISFCPSLESVYRGSERLLEKLKEDNPKILLEW